MIGETEEPKEPTPDGVTFDQERDGDRLKTQHGRVRALMADMNWRTLPQIADAVGGSEAAVSARLRDLRKDKFGGHEVERRHIKSGLFEYRLILNRTLV